ncbi:MAG: AraC family transcriptional regulator, partial [Roseovarius sp.]
MPRPQKFVFYLIDEFAHLSFSCAIEPLRIANLVSGKTLYEWSFASENGETALSSNGTVVRVHAGFDARVKADRLFLLSGLNMRAHISRPLLSALRRERSHGTPLGALCSGAYIFAYAGLLVGMRGAIHWAYH